MSIADNESGNGRAGQAGANCKETRSALRDGKQVSGGKKGGALRTRKASSARPRKNGKSSRTGVRTAKRGEGLRPGLSLDEQNDRMVRREQRAARIDGAADFETLSSEDLCCKYQATRDALYRDSLALRHLQDVVELARYLSMRLPKSVDLEDLSNAGYSGLLRCIDTFDVERGRSFVSYMKQRVYGAMVDELRTMDWLPRLMRSRLSHRDQLFQELRQDLGRDPCDEEIAEKLEVDVETYQRNYSGDAAKLGAGLLTGTDYELDQLESCIVGLGLRGRDADDRVHPLTPLYHRELIGKIQHLLTETEWSLVELHYFDGLKLREVAERLSLSPARICQIHGRVLQRLKEKLRTEGVSI